MSRRILVVEDDSFAQQLLVGLLQRAGYDADAAPDGFAALALLRENAYGLAFIDYHLPAMDGYALAKLMRDATRASAPLKLVAVTADSHGLSARRDVDTVFDSVLSKPFEPQAAIELVEQASAAGQAAQNKPSGLRAAAAAFIADPTADHARRAAASFWRSRGLAGCPKVHALPAPTPSQAADINLCFDLMPFDRADLILLTGPAGIAPLRKLRAQGGARLPVVTVDKSLTSVADLFFRIDDPNAWTALARRLRESEPEKIKVRV